MLCESMEVDFVKEMIEIQVRHHGVDLQKETIINSDQCSHYTNITFIKILKDNGIRRQYLGEGIAGTMHRRKVSLAI